MQTPTYIKTLLQPNGKKTASRKVWSVDLESVWLPFFTATNVQGDTAISRESLGAPLRLAKDCDGSVKFSRNGRPVTRIAPELSQQIKIVRENFTAGLTAYAGQVMNKKPSEYKAEVEACQKAGEPILTHDQMDLEMALSMMQAKMQAETKSHELVEATA